MPLYQCHKIVWALKIAAIQSANDSKRPTVEELESLLKTQEELEIDTMPNGEIRAISSAIITPSEPGFAPFKVSAKYVKKHKPEAGGYYVRYIDGYESYSPAKAFEEGYNRLH